jgi:hypothetical protein
LHRRADSASRQRPKASRRPSSAAVALMLLRYREVSGYVAY